MKRQRSRIVLAALALLSAVLPAVVEPQGRDKKWDEPFENAKSKALQNLQTDEGNEYSSTVLIPFALAKGKAERKCFNSHRKSAAAGMEVVFKVARDGAIQELLIRPQTGFTNCLAKEMEKAKFPEPPSRGHWVHFASSGSY